MGAREVTSLSEEASPPTRCPPSPIPAPVSHSPLIPGLAWGPGQACTPWFLLNHFCSWLQIGGELLGVWAGSSSSSSALLFVFLVLTPVYKELVLPCFEHFMKNKMFTYCRCLCRVPVLERVCGGESLTASLCLAIRGQHSVGPGSGLSLLTPRIGLGEHDGFIHGYHGGTWRAIELTPVLRLVEGDKTQIQNTNCPGSAGIPASSGRLEFLQVIREREAQAVSS